MHTGKVGEVTQELSPRGVKLEGSSLPPGSLWVSGENCTSRGSPPSRFQVDFQCGCSLCPRPDIAFHFNPRFHTTKPHVICNTLHGGRWQREARWPHLALQKGSSFLILFLFGNEEVKVKEGMGIGWSRICVLAPFLPFPDSPRRSVGCHW